MGGLIILMLALGLRLALAMEMDIRLDSFSPRSLAPVPVTVTLKGDAPLTEGTLAIRLKQQSQTLIDYQTDPLIVTSEPREIRLLLPAMVMGNMGDSQGTWELTFHTDTQRFVRDDLIISIPDFLQTTAVVAVVHPNFTDPPEALAELIRRFTLEEMMGFGAGGQNVMGVRRLFTAQARLKPEQLPTTAVAFGGYDVVAISPEGFAKLSGRQLDALSSWIRAGGSTLITTDPNQPVSSTSAVAPFLKSISSEESALTIVDRDDQEILGIKLTCQQWDLGRIALLQSLDLKADQDALAWPKLFRFLWKVRDLEAIDRSVNMHRPTTVSRNNGLEAAQWSQAARQRLFRELMPGEAQLLSGFQFASIMLAFLLVVGPLEYRLLRRTRRRWLTWITFPVTIVILTLGLFLLAENLLGKTAVKRLTLVDLGTTGKGVRSSEVALTFSRKAGRTTSEHQKSVVSPVHQHTPSAWGTPFGNALHYAGRFPAAYTTAHDVRQWSPHMDSTFAIPSAVETPEILRAIDWTDFKRPPSLTRLQERLRAIKGIDGIVYFAAPELIPLERWGESTNLLINLARPSLDSAGLTIPHRTSFLNRRGSKLPPPSRWVPFPQPASPRGDGYLSDWTVLDHDQWLITWKQSENHRMVFRYIYTNND